MLFLRKVGIEEKELLNGFVKDYLTEPNGITNSKIDSNYKYLNTYFQKMIIDLPF